MRALLLTFLLGWVQVPAALLELRLPLTGEGESRDAYQYALLHFLLSKVGVDYRMRIVPIRFSQARVQLELEKGDLINLYWMGTSPELERRLLPVRYPLFRGLLGYRLLIIHKGRQADFDQVRSLRDLGRFIGGQGIGWADVAILERAGLKQIQVQYDTILGMVNAGHLDYFSRGVTEIFAEVAEHRRHFGNITIERHLLLHYPFAMFFFVSPNYPALAEALKRGFEKAYADGSFERFFYAYPGVRDALERANFDQRLRLEIPNPFLTPETRNIPARYWHSPADG